MTQSTDHNEGPGPLLDWGKGLALVIALFICGTLGVVAYLVSLDYHMVSDNHYEEAVRYQEHIDKVEQARAMQQPVAIALMKGEQAIEIRFPDTLSFTPDSLRGRIELYRPSDPSMDRTIDLRLNPQGIQRIGTGALAPGKWSVRISWSAGGNSFFKESSIFLSR